MNVMIPCLRLNPVANLLAELVRALQLHPSGLEVVGKAIPQFTSNVLRLLQNTKH
jgi:hypothetical protein